MTAPARVTVFDPGPDAARTADDVLADGRFEVTVIDSGDAATEAVRNGDVDCLVLRQRLPDDTGVDLLRAVRDADPDLPVILVSETGDDVLLDALHAGVTDVVPADDPDAAVLTDRIQLAIERQRYRIAADDLERVRSVIREVNRALLRAESPGTLRRETCDILSRGDPYVFAWIGTVDEASGTVDPVAWGGSGAAYLEDFTVTVDDTPTGRGPAGQAVKSGEVVVIRDADTDPRFEPWRERAAEFGFESVAAVPLAYEGETYGVLGVYADRAVAFDDLEREMLAEVGDDLGYALHALETRAELERHAELVTHAPIGVFTTEPGPDGVVVEANPALARILDAPSVDDVVGRRVADFYVDPTARKRVTETLEPGTEATAQVRLRTLEGREIVCRSTVVQVRRASGDVQLMGALQDVTQRVALEADLTAEREFVEQLLEISPAAIIVFDADGDVVRANAEAERILEVSRTELLASHHDDNPWDAIDETGAPVPVEDRPFRMVLERGRPVMDVEYGIRFPDGHERWLSTNAVPLFDGDAVSRVVLVVDDLTEHHEHQVALERERDRFRAIFEDAFDAMVLADDDGEYTAANPAAEALFGLPAADLVGRSIGDFATADFDFDAAWTAFSDNTAEHGLFELQRPDGERRFVEYSATRNIVPGQHLSILRDVTERLAYESQLREQNRRLETVLDNTPVVLFAFDADGALTFVTGEGLAETGTTPEDIVGETVDRLFDDQPGARDLLGRAVAGESVHGDVRIAGRDFEVWARPTDDPSPTEDEERAATIGVALDVTETRAAAAEARARQDQIAFFNSLLRHEVLNGLAVVLGNADLVREELDDADPFVPHVDRILSRSRDIVETVRRIRVVLDKLAIADPEHTVHDLAAITRERLDQLRSDHPDAAFTLDAPETAPVYADDLLGDVVFNVASNAVTHNSADHPTVDVTITSGTGQTHLRIADDGPGISDAVLDVLRAETNEHRSWATAGSFGLYFVFTMVDRYGGHIDVSTPDDGGTVLDLSFPTAPPDDRDTAGRDDS